MTHAYLFPADRPKGGARSEPSAYEVDHMEMQAHLRRGLRIRSAYWRHWVRRALDLVLGRPPTMPPYADPAAIIPAEAVDDLLAMNDNDLAALGIRRGDVVAFRDGRIKYVKRWQ